MIAALIASIIASLIIAAASVVIRKRATSGISAEREELSAQIPQATAQLQELIANSGKKASKAILDQFTRQVGQISAEVEKEKDHLKAIETRLDEAQKMVETREAAQQAVKSAKDEEEAQVQGLLQRFEQISSESMSLEHNLATSLKNLDQLMTEVQLTPDQKALLDELSNSLTSASARLRDLLTEYATVNDRLSLLQQQQRDLEEEYTRLVEQQLGE